MHAVEGLKVRTSVHGSRKVRNLRIAEMFALQWHISICYKLL